MRLINADELMELYDGCDGLSVPIAVVQQNIKDATTIDAETVRHGEWEIVVGSNGKEYMVCTCCRVSQDLTGVFTYCPNCGAKMDGELNE